MSLSIKCVWCDKPLLDAEHAKKHVAEQCTAAPWRKQIEELKRGNTRQREVYEQAIVDLRDTAQRLAAEQDRNTHLRRWGELRRRAARQAVEEMVAAQSELEVIDDIVDGRDPAEFNLGGCSTASKVARALASPAVPEKAAKT